jgi:hypothetical protein
MGGSYSTTWSAVAVGLQSFWARVLIVGIWFILDRLRRDIHRTFHRPGQIEDVSNTCFIELAVGHPLPVARLLGVIPTMSIRRRYVLTFLALDSSQDGRGDRGISTPSAVVPRNS